MMLRHLEVVEQLAGRSSYARLEACRRRRMVMHLELVEQLAGQCDRFDPFTLVLRLAAITSLAPLSNALRLRLRQVHDGEAP
jgi:hypothetical protein